MASCKLLIIISVMVILSIALLKVSQAKELGLVVELEADNLIHEVPSEAEEGKIRVRRGARECTAKCKNLGRRGGRCVSSAPLFYSLVCGARGVTCTCF